MNYKVHTFFLNLNSRILKEIQGENLHNFKEILLMMYVYHKAAFTFEVSFSTSTYDARWMCFNFTHILMNIVGSIDLHNSLQTFSIRMVWELKLFRAFWSYTPHKVKQMCICKRDIKMKNNAVQNKNTISGVYCSSRSFEHIFPAILKTVHSEKSNSNK